MSFDFVADIEHYAIFEMGPDGRVATWNAGAERIKGYSRSEILGTHYRTFFVDDAISTGAPEQLLARAENEGAIKGQGWRVRKDGERFWAEFSLTALFDESGALSGFAKVVRDATAQRQYERLFEQQTEQLEEFAEQVSHDLRNPLGVARANLKLAREECDSSYLDVVSNAVERASETVDDQLALARDGENAGTVEDIALAEMAKWCWQTIDTTNETLVLETDRTVTAIPSRLKPIFDNLLGNAVEHGGRGVTVTVGDLEDGFYVADNGTGIPESERGRVFERKYTLGDGTGLGLHLVRRNVVAQGWDISVTESETGGAQFEITDVDTTE
ncbi:sensor histidine kinase [Haloarcula brevis]|uniref:sensor histidine kinase n=1 Tax=Haloarcula brevis TaxID=3111453 RepID=UPI00300E734B